MTAIQPLQIFRAGAHTTMDGRSIDFSAADIDATAASYAPALHEAPLVIGHPEHNQPAYGWVKSLFSASGVLSAEPGQVAPEFAELVNAGRYKKISASFYPPQSSANPKPGVYYLRHVGFLGAMPPAVKGLQDAQFAADTNDEIITIEFGAARSDPEPTETSQENPMTPEQIAAQQADIVAREAKLREAEQRIKDDAILLAEQNADLTKREQTIQAAEAAGRRAAHTAHVDTLVSSGRVLPRDRDGLVAFLEAQDRKAVIEFGEKEAKTSEPAENWLRKFLDGLPVRVAFGEHAGSGNTAGLRATDTEIARRARDYKLRRDAKGDNISYGEAVNAVVADKDRE